MTVTRACHGKRPHRTAGLAEKHRQRLIRLGAAPGALQTYRCKHCSTPAVPVWHVGHAKNRAKWRTR